MHFKCKLITQACNIFINDKICCKVRTYPETYNCIYSGYLLYVVTCNDINGMCNCLSNNQHSCVVCTETEIHFINSACAIFNNYACSLPPLAIISYSCHHPLY